jgi:lysophospholipase L1-like esterase
MFSNTTARFTLLAAIALTAGAALTHAQTTAQPAEKPAATQPAATQPAAPVLTPEQQAILKTINSAPTDKPFPKMESRTTTKDGLPNPLFGKIQPGFQATHEVYLKRAEKPIGVLFLGDSITQGWNHSGKAIWTERYAKLDAANFGIGGDRTEHVLWRIENGELDNISPKVVVLMIGTNNSGNSAQNITAGVTAIVKKVNEKLPNSKLLLLAIFPRGAAAVDAKGNPSPVRAKLDSVNSELAKLDDGKKTFYLDIGAKFLDEKGNLPADVMPDALHPNTKGYQIWADAMQPKLEELLK